MDNKELPEQFEQDMLNAELTPDERMVAEEDMHEIMAEMENEPLEPTPSEPRPNPESNGQVIDDYTIRRAKDYNFTDEDISAFGTQQQLNTALNQMDAQVLAKLNKGVPQDAIQTEPAPVQEPEAQPEEAELQLDEFMDPTIAANFRAQQQQYQQLKEQHEALLQHVQGQMHVDEMSQFDDRISRLGDNFHQLLGSTVDERRNPTTGAYANASQLWDVYVQLKHVSPNMTDDDVFRRSVAATFPDQQVQFAEQRVRHDVSNRLRDSQGRFVARPSKRGSVSQPPGQDQEAQEWIETWAAERGIGMAPAMSLDEMLDS